MITLIKYDKKLMILNIRPEELSLPSREDRDNVESPIIVETMVINDSNNRITYKRYNLPKYFIMSSMDALLMS